MKRFFITLIFFILMLPSFSQTAARRVEKGEEAWRYIIKAREALYSGDYSSAIKNAELAKSSQKQEADWELYQLQNTQKKRKIRKAGDDIYEVLSTMKELKLTEAVSIVQKHLEERSADYFDGKFSVLLEKEAFFAFCPEADYIIAKVYQIEGEYDLALRYMNLAYEYSDNLIVENQKYEILYELADLAYDLQSDNDYEKYLLSVLKDNPYYTDRNFMNAFTSFVKNDNAEGVEKFFLLYRNNCYDSIKALSKLSKFYTSKGENQKALECAALASITIVTKLEEALKDRLIDYSYTTFEDLLIKVSRFEDIIDWGSDNFIWESLYLFADIASSDARINFSSRLFSVLAGCLSDNYWSKMAARRVNMNVD